MIASTSLSIIPDILVKEPVVIAIDDTTIVKIGKNSQVSSTCMIIQFTIQKTHGQWSLFCEPYNVCSGNGNSKRLPATNPLCSHFRIILSIHKVHVPE